MYSLVTYYQVVFEYMQGLYIVLFTSKSKEKWLLISVVLVYTCVNLHESCTVKWLDLL